jgi:hypothetical protein
MLSSGNMTDILVAEALPDRRTALVVFGCFQLVVAVLVWCLGVFMMLMPMPAGTNVRMGGVALFVGIWGAFIFACGIGSIRRRSWARVLTLVWSGMWLGMSLFGLAGGIVSTQTMEVPAAVSKGAILAILVIAGLLLGVLPPAVLLFVYSRKSVRASCAGPALRKPILILILSAWFAFGGVAVTPGLFGPPILILFGTIVHGATAIAADVAIGCLYFFTAWQIFRQRRSALKLGLLASAFGGALGVVNLALTDMDQFMREAGLASLPATPQMTRTGMLSAVLGAAIQMALLLYARRYFDDRGAPPTTPQA